MAGYKSSEPRNKGGEWAKGATGVVAKVKGEKQTYGESGFPLPAHMSKPVPPNPGYQGRPKPNFKVPAGKPRTMFQHTPTKNPSAPVKKARLSVESYLAKQGMKLESVKRDAAEGKRWAVVELEKANKAVDQLKSGFSNVPAETSRKNYNLPPVPKFHGKGLQTKVWDGTSDKVKRVVRPVHEHVVTRLTKEAEVHRNNQMAKQKDARKTRDAVTDKILQNPDHQVFYQVGGSPMLTGYTPHVPKVKKAMKGFNAGFNAVDNLFTKAMKVFKI